MIHAMSFCARIHGGKEWEEQRETMPSGVNEGRFTLIIPASSYANLKQTSGARLCYKCGWFTSCTQQAAKPVQFINACCHMFVEYSSRTRTSAFSSVASRRLQAKLLQHHHVLCTKMALPKYQQKKTTHEVEWSTTTNTPIHRAKHPNMQLGYMVCHYYTGDRITSQCGGLWPAKIELELSSKTYTDLMPG